jgi:hypothetical protein
MAVSFLTSAAGGCFPLRNGTAKWIWVFFDGLIGNRFSKLMQRNLARKLRADCCSSMQQRAPSFAHAGNLGTGEIDFPVRRHEQLHGFNLRIMRAQIPACMNELIAQVFDRVTKNLQGMARLGRNAPAMCAALVVERS